MQIVKIRRVGNSDVVTLPHQLEAAGSTPGTSVVIEEAPTGELILMPEDWVRARVREIGRRVIEQDREALDLLAAYDRGEANSVDGELRRLSASRSSPDD